MQILSILTEIVKRRAKGEKGKRGKQRERENKGEKGNKGGTKEEQRGERRVLLNDDCGRTNQWRVPRMLGHVGMLHLQHWRRLVQTLL